MAAYGTNEGFLLWVEGQGLTIPATADIDVLRQIGSFYIDAAYGYMLSCSKRTGGWEQELEFPRTGHVVNGQALPPDLIPTPWIYASYRAAYINAISPGWSTNQVTPGRVVKRQKADVLEREFFGPDEVGGGSATAPGFPSDAAINGLVLPFLCSKTRSLNSLFRVV